MYKLNITAASAVLVLSILGGCSNNDDDAQPPVTEQVPASASESSSGFIAYVKELITFDSDTLEPVDISSVTPPADETAEPVSID